MDSSATSSTADCDNLWQTLREASPYADRLSRALAGNTARRASRVGSPGGARSTVPSPVVRNDSGDSGRSSFASQSPLEPPPNEAAVKRQLSRGLLRAGDGSDLTMPVRLTPAAPPPVAAHMELELHKPSQTSVIGMQCDPSPPQQRGGPSSVEITAMNDKALGFKAGLRVEDALLSVSEQPCEDPTQTATLLKTAEGTVVFELLRSEGAVKPKANPLFFWTGSGWETHCSR